MLGECEVTIGFPAVVSAVRLTGPKYTITLQVTELIRAKLQALTTKAFADHPTVAGDQGGGTRPLLPVREAGVMLGCPISMVANIKIALRVAADEETVLDLVDKATYVCAFLRPYGPIAAKGERAAATAGLALTMQGMQVVGKVPSVPLTNSSPLHPTYTLEEMLAEPVYKAVHVLGEGGPSSPPSAKKARR
jgi:hypothetical protein